MAAVQSEAFKKAVEDSKKLTSKPSNDELLELYGESRTPRSIRGKSSPRGRKTTQSEENTLYHLRACADQHPSSTPGAALFKVATGEDITKSPAPGMFDLKVRRPQFFLFYF